MQLRISTILLAALLLLSINSSVIAQSRQVVNPAGKDTVMEGEPLEVEKPGKNEVAVKNVFYMQNDSGGIEQVDEDAAIFETLIIVDMEIAENDRLNVRLLGDLVSAASIKRDHNEQFRALQGGASGTTRVGVGAGWTHQFDGWTLGGDIDFSTEYAYNSVGLGINASKEFNEKNTILGISLQTFYDNLKMIRYNGQNENDETRDTITVGLNWTQILTPRSLMNLSLQHTEQSGFLATQFNSVFIDNGTDPEYEDYEILPDSRSRDSITLRYKSAIGSKDAWEAGVRYYTDDWGIDAQTLDFKYFKYLYNKKVLLEGNYRYYQQTEADYYRDGFSSAQEYQTSDPDLGDFTGHMLGLKATFINAGKDWWQGDTDVGINYYTRDNGLDMYWLTIGKKFNF